MSHANPEFSFCESVMATATSPRCIRKLPKGESRKLGGGVTTSSLCGRVKLGAGWDLSSPVVVDTGGRLPPGTCKRCAAAWGSPVRVRT